MPTPPSDRRREGALALAALALLCCPDSIPGAGPEPLVRIGTLTTRSAEATLARWTPLARYLESRVPGYRFELVPLSGSGFESAIGNLQFALCPVALYVDLDARMGVTPLATLRSRLVRGAQAKRMGGAVVTRSGDAGIRRLGELRGKRVAAVDPMVMGGWISAWRELRKEGIDPRSDFRELRFLGSSDAVIDAVLAGEADAGVTTTGVLERAAAQGRIDLRAFRVLPPPADLPGEPGFPFARSTRLYPESPFVKLPGVPEELARRVTLALLTMEEDSGVARATETAGWSIPADYRDVQECMKELRLGPYRNFGRVTLASAVRQHQGMISMALLGLAALLGGAAVWLLRLNRRLRAAGRRRLESEEKFRRLVENQGEGVAVLDAEDSLLFCNPAMEEIFGFEPGQAGSMNLTELVCAEDRATVQAETARRRAGVRSAYEVAITRLDGQRRELLVTATPRLDSGSEFRGTVAIFRDITERKRLEERLRETNKLESVGRLAGGVAHDFNNLLTVINGYSDVALSRIDSGNPLRPPLEAVQQAGERAAELTAQLLAFSRKQVIRPEPRDLNAVVMDAAEMLGRMVGEDVELVTRLNPSPLPVLVDGGQMHQVLMDLAAHARDAMPGGGRLVLETAESSDPVPPDAASGDYVRLAVTDTGGGMDEETRRNIFEPFFTTRETGKGAGLGLSAVYGVVRQNRGWIAVLSEPGRGTTFQIYLPRHGVS